MSWWWTVVPSVITIMIAIGGDGGIYGEGLNHLIAAARANIDVKVFVLAIQRKNPPLMQHMAGH